jgi:hypothetical protein
VQTRPFLLLLLLSDCAFLLPSLQTPPPCPPGTVLCNNLSCSDLRSDPFNCGFCENVCGQGLSCKLIPDGGYFDAGTLDAGLPPLSSYACLCTIPGGTFWNGACYNLASDPSNCGGIGAACASTQVCVDGLCSCAGLDAGAIVECVEDAGPVCANLSSDPHRCGSCGNDCGDLGYCSAGQCYLSLASSGGDGGSGDGGLGDGGDGGP